MKNPSACATLLTADRPEMTRQAIECFRAQTYENKRLLILDTGKSRNDAHVYIGNHGQPENERLLWNPAAKETIGELRNLAASMTDADIIVTFDSDDWSHPNRIAEQVALLKSSGADVVGYNSMLFWREPQECECGALPRHKDRGDTGEAWLYSNSNPQYALGTSLCYWRHVWERKPFEATSMGEDDRFLRGLKVAPVTSIFDKSGPPPDFAGIAGAWARGAAPRMIARIHTSNTSTAYSPRKMEKAREWRRVSEWDKYCQGVFA